MNCFADLLIDNWLGDKAKFPDTLRAVVFDVGVAAYHNGMFNFKEGIDEPFFHALPSVLPYNCFTLTVSPTSFAVVTHTDNVETGGEIVL
jgi:hypothetical protein